jgi:hypothetical protein
MDSLKSPRCFSCPDCDIMGIVQPIPLLVLPQVIGEAALPQRLFEVVLAPLAVGAVKLL